MDRSVLFSIPTALHTGLSNMSEFGSAVPVTLAGKDYRFSPLTYGDIEELDNWVRGEYMTRVLKAIPKDADPADREMAMKIAQNTVSTMTWLSGKGAIIMTSVRGMVKIAALSLQKNHPELTDERLRQIILDEPDTFKTLSEALRASAGPASTFRVRPTDPPVPAA